MSYCLDSKEVAAAAKAWLEERGVRIADIVELVIMAQSSYYPQLTEQDCEESIERVLAKREVQNAILTGIQLDVLSEQGKLASPIQEIIANDERLYGIDEILALSIVNVYGSIGLTNFGYFDKTKPGILAKLNNKEGPMLHTFLDDIVAAIAAAASSSIAHRKQEELEKEREENNQDCN